MILPTIHLNGTSRYELYSQSLKAWQALQDACKAIEEAQPNARDYYVQHDAAYSMAHRQWKAQHTAILATIAHFQALLTHLQGTD